MGTWICHLRIAEQLLATLPNLDEALFMCGNLAPDSGIPNADWTVFDPPKEVTHFLNSGEDEGRIRDLEFYVAHLAALDPMADPARYSFVLGYFTHLLCDNLWSKRIVSASKRDYAQLLTERGREAWGILKDDWYGLDVLYVRAQPDCSFWRVLMQMPNPPSYLSFVPQPALHHQLDHIRQFYSQPDPEWVLERPFPYLNEAAMSRFVDEAVHAILLILARRDRLAGLQNTHTALTLLDPQQRAPFPAPLGDTINVA